MTTAGTRRAQPYVGALDGLRALAVIAVVAYHASLASAPGGFFGVDVFFVISGYLVTALLLDRAALPGTSDLLDFWRRRLLRLVPAALGAVTATLAIFAALQVRGPGTLSVEAASALSYVANWVWVARDQSYFETAARPSPFLHFWSLAVEAQFYLVWPLLIALALRAGGRLTLFLLALSLGAISVVVGSALYDPLGDPSRAYYGTDARAAGLLLGATLGVVARPGLRGAVGRPLAEVAGWGGLLVLAWLVTRGSEFDPFTYRGGFFVASVATVAVMLSALHGRNSVSAALAFAPLRWIGLRSYSIYLWHWPVVVLTHPHMSSALQSWNLAVARFAATVILAEISYRLVENRFRTGHADDARGLPEWSRRTAARRVFQLLPPRAWGIARSPWTPPGMVVAAALGAIVFAGGLPIRAGSTDVSIPVARVAGHDFDFDGIAIDVTRPPTSATPAERVVSATVTPEAVSPASRLAIGLQPAYTPAATPAQASGIASSVSDAGGAPPATGTVLPAAGTAETPVSVTAIGDSVMVAAVPALAGVLPGLYVDAEVGRQFWSAAALVDVLRADGALGDVVVIHLGSNGPFTDEQFEALMAALDGVPGVVFVNVTVPRRWEADVNRALAAQTAGRTGVAMADWYALSHDAPEFFAADGVHLTAAGQEAYAMLIDEHVRAVLAAPR